MNGRQYEHSLIYDTFHEVGVRVSVRMDHVEGRAWFIVEQMRPDPVTRKMECYSREIDESSRHYLVSFGQDVARSRAPLDNPPAER